MFEKNSVILFQGDSITDGGRSGNDDPNHFLGHGYASMISGRLGADYPAANFTFLNRGISGNRISDLYGRWKEDAINLKPDVVSVLAGINDVGSTIRHDAGSDPIRFKKIYTSMLNEILDAKPKTKIVVCEPFFLPNKDRQPDSDTWMSGTLRIAEATREVAEETNADFIPLQKMFNKACELAPASYWLWDGIHPTVAGHELLTRTWLKKMILQ